MGNIGMVGCREQTCWRFVALYPSSTYMTKHESTVFITADNSTEVLLESEEPTSYVSKVCVRLGNVCSMYFSTTALLNSTYMVVNEAE